MDNENSATGYVIFDIEPIDSELEEEYKKAILATNPSEEDVIEILSTFEHSINLIVKTMRQEKVVLEKMLANGEFKKKV